jgi:LmbE family N-acetylglucosaminyl deacetylase
LRLLAVLAHPDDESLGLGGLLARSSAEGVEACVLTATRGQRGRFYDQPSPGEAEVGRVREAELRAAGRELGVREVRVLDYMDGELDAADPGIVAGEIAAEIRRIRPQVVVTFGADGAYGHPDHIAISQLTGAAIARAGDSGWVGPGPEAAHLVPKFYWIAWGEATWARYEAAVKRLASKVDGVVRHANPWPDWAITTSVDATAQWRTVWRAVQCHATQIHAYGRLPELSEAEHREIWGRQEFYRVFSLVNGGRERETDVFDGLR